MSYANCQLSVQSVDDRLHEFEMYLPSVNHALPHGGVKVFPREQQAEQLCMFFFVVEITTLKYYSAYHTLSCTKSAFTCLCIRRGTFVRRVLHRSGGEDAASQSVRDSSRSAGICDRHIAVRTHCTSTRTRRCISLKEESLRVCDGETRRIQASTLII